MTVKKHHDFPNHLLAGPAGRDAFEALAPDPLDFPQAIGCVLDNGEDVRPEGLHELFGEERPDSLHHPRAQVLFNTRGGRRLMNAKPFCLELPPVFPIDDPLTGSRGVFARRDGGRVADERNEVAFALHFEPQDAEAVLSVVEGDALHQTRDLGKRRRSDGRGGRGCARIVR